MHKSISILKYFQVLFFISVLLVGIAPVYAQYCSPPTYSCPAGRKCDQNNCSRGLCVCVECVGNYQACGGNSDCCSGSCQSGSCATDECSNGNHRTTPPCCDGWVRSGSTCVQEDPEDLGGLDDACVGTGCGANCGQGLACVNGTCTFDDTCFTVMERVPYDGPIIESLSQLFGVLYGILYPAAILLAGVMIIFAGYKLMTSEGNPQKVKEGQEDLTSAIVGGLFVILSAAILRIIIKSILGGDVNF